MTTNAYGPTRGLRHLDRRGMLLLICLLVIPGVALIVGRSVPALDPILESPVFHLYVVSAIAACALLVALATATYAVRDGRAAPVLIALGCVGVGFMMLGHGLTTPGIFNRPMNLWVARLPVLALATFAGCLAAASRPDGMISRVVARSPHVALGFPMACVALVCAAIAIQPTVLSGASPIPFEESIRTAVLVVSSITLLLVGAVHWRRWKMGRDRIELALVLASWLTMSAILSFAYGTFWRLSWWDYHIYLLTAFAAAAWVVVSGYRDSRTLAGAVGAITMVDPLEQVAHSQPDALHALIGAVEAKDPYTHGHSSRVAELSTRIGLTLALEPDVIRGLHQGAFLHDVGKISVPDRILNKPGDLDAEEWEQIQRHPEVGWDLVSRADSLHGALSAIRHHHERWDGTGYPDRLSGADIPLSGRIVAVADVWDALTSDRAYRPAWPLDRAVSHVAAASGTLFDPTCVEAFLDVVAENGLVPEHTRADLGFLMHAAGDCHPTERRPASAARARPTPAPQPAAHERAEPAPKP